MALLLCVILATSFAVSTSKPVSTGLDAFLVDGACDIACESQWWGVEPENTFASDENCKELVCKPISAHFAHSGKVKARSDDPVPLLEDFLVNCDSLCEAEWWLDGLGFESADACRAVVCGVKLAAVESGHEEADEPVAAQAEAQDKVAPVEPASSAPVLRAADDDLASNVRGKRQPVTEMVSDAHEIVMPAPPMAHVSMVPPSPSSTLICYSHSDCPASRTFCASDNRCYDSTACGDTAGHGRLTPVDAICPDGAPEYQEVQVHTPLSVEQVVVYAGQFVDQIQFVLSNSTVLKYGEHGGDVQPPWKVPAGEWITWAKVRQGGNLDSIQFYTNRGNSSPVYGGPGGRKQIFHVDREHQLLGLERSGETMSAPVTGIMQTTREADASAQA